MLKKAVFLDRDGTIIKDNGYINDLKHIEFYSFTNKALKILQKEFLLFIVTNQSGIGKGLIEKKDVEILNENVLKHLKKNGIKIIELFYCPHKTEDNCDCKKPEPYFIKLAAEKYNLNTDQSYVVGDHRSDMDFAKNAGAKGVFVLTGHGKKHLKEIDKNTIVSKNLYYAALRIMSSSKKDSN